MWLTNLQGEKTGGVPPWPHRMKSLAGRIGHRRSVREPGKLAHKRMSRTGTKNCQTWNISDVHTHIYLGCFAHWLSTDRESFESRQDSVRENLLHLSKVSVDVLQCGN